MPQNISNSPSNEKENKTIVEIAKQKDRRLSIRNYYSNLVKRADSLNNFSTSIPNLPLNSKNSDFSTINSSISNYEAHSPNHNLDNQSISHQKKFNIVNSFLDRGKEMEDFTAGEISQEQRKEISNNDEKRFTQNFAIFNKNLSLAGQENPTFTEESILINSNSNFKDPKNNDFQLNSNSQPKIKKSNFDNIIKGEISHPNSQNNVLKDENNIHYNHKIVKNDEILNQSKILNDRIHDDDYMNQTQAINYNEHTMIQDDDYMDQTQAINYNEHTMIQDDDYMDQTQAINYNEHTMIQDDDYMDQTQAINYNENTVIQDDDYIDQIKVINDNQQKMDQKQAINDNEHTLIQDGHYMNQTQVINDNDHTIIYDSHHMSQTKIINYDDHKVYDVNHMDQTEILNNNDHTIIQDDHYMNQTNGIDNSDHKIIDDGKLLLRDDKNLKSSQKNEKFIIKNPSNNEINEVFDLKLQIIGEKVKKIDYEKENFIKKENLKSYNVQNNTIDKENGKRKISFHTNLNNKKDSFIEMEVERFYNEEKFEKKDSSVNQNEKLNKKNESSVSEIQNLECEVKEWELERSPIKFIDSKRWKEYTTPLSNRIRRLSERNNTCEISLNSIENSIPMLDDIEKPIGFDNLGSPTIKTPKNLVRESLIKDEQKWPIEYNFSPLIAREKEKNENYETFGSPKPIANLKEFLQESGIRFLDNLAASTRRDTIYKTKDLEKPTIEEILFTNLITLKELYIFESGCNLLQKQIQEGKLRLEAIEKRFKYDPPPIYFKIMEGNDVKVQKAILKIKKNLARIKVTKKWYAWRCKTLMPLCEAFEKILSLCKEKENITRKKKEEIENVRIEYEKYIFKLEEKLKYLKNRKSSLQSFDSHRFEILDSEIKEFNEKIANLITKKNEMTSAQNEILQRISGLSEKRANKILKLSELNLRIEKMNSISRISLIYSRFKYFLASKMLGLQLYKAKESKIHFYIMRSRMEVILSFLNTLENKILLRADFLPIEVKSRVPKSLSEKNLSLFLSQICNFEIRSSPFKMDFQPISNSLDNSFFIISNELKPLMIKVISIFSWLFQIRDEISKISLRFNVILSLIQNHNEIPQIQIIIPYFDYDKEIRYDIKFTLIYGKALNISDSIESIEIVSLNFSMKIPLDFVKIHLPNFSIEPNPILKAFPVIVKRISST